MYASRANLHVGPFRVPQAEYCGAKLLFRFPNILKVENVKLIHRLVVLNIQQTLNPCAIKLLDSIK